MSAIVSCLIPKYKWTVKNSTFCSTG